MGSFLQTLDNFFNAGTGFLFGSGSLVIFSRIIALDTRKYIDGSAVK